MAFAGFDALVSEISTIATHRRAGRVVSIGQGTIEVAGLGPETALGDRVRIALADGSRLEGEVLALSSARISVLPDAAADGVSLGARVDHLGQAGIAPDDSWIGRIVDPFGHALDGRPLLRGRAERALRAQPPAAARRRRLGARLETGVAAFNTLLPLVRGQRLGLFAGSGVGKSSLLGKFARGVSADVVVVALIGERGRELREFVEHVMGPEGMARSVIVAATSDQSPLVRRRCAWSAMAVAEHFRDQGKHVLLLADSITRFAEAHREVALAGGSLPACAAFRPRPRTRSCHWPNGQVRVKMDRATSRQFSACWWPGPTWRNRWPTSCAACLTGMSCWIARSPNAGAIRRSICCARCRDHYPWPRPRRKTP